MFTDIFLPELMGTAILILLGCGVVANVVLPKTGGFGGGTLLINFGWGLGVYAGVYVAYQSGAHLTPAVTLGLVAAGGSGSTMSGRTASSAAKPGPDKSAAKPIPAARYASFTAARGVLILNSSPARTKPH